MTRIRLAVFISGRGSNLKALIDACREPNYPAEIVLVVSNQADAPGLTYASQENIPTITVPHNDRKLFARIVQEELDDHRIELIALAGFMRVLDAEFVQRWEDRILNIHPSLLPDFPGLHPHQQALDAEATETGCTVHWVTPLVDAGPIIAQTTVPVRPGDTEDTLAARILEAEHQLYPRIIRKVAEELQESYIGEDGTVS